MRKSVRWGRVLVAGLAASLWLGGCHADPNDAAGQAGELSDPVRRRNAISNIRRLYTTALAEANGDRSAAPVRAIADATIDKLVEAFVTHTDDPSAGTEIMGVFEEMRDPRSLDAVVQALDWRPGTEQQAISASKIVRWVEVPADKKGPIIEALGAAVSRVRQNRPEDNRLRREAILALGELGDPRAAPHLVQIVERSDESQSFLFNRLAARELARVATADQIPVFIRGLFLYDPSRPQIRMEDVAQSGLVQIGEASIEPLLELYRGNNDEVEPLVVSFVEAVNQATRSNLNAEAFMQERAIATLGQIGHRAAFDTLKGAARNEELPETVRWEAAVALVSLSLERAELAQVREVLQSVYEQVELPRKPRILAAMRQTYDPAYLSFILEQARDRDLHPDLRLTAVQTYAQLANKEEAAALASLIAEEPLSEDGGFRNLFEQSNPVIAAADECDEDLSCWIGKLGNSDPKIAVKASYMLGRLGQGNADAISALVQRLGHPDVQVRFASVQALDHIALEGSPEAVARIDELANSEEGQSVWNQFSQQALPIQSRLRNRGE